MHDNQVFRLGLGILFVAVVVVLSTGCEFSKPLPTIDNVTDGMLLAFPGAKVVDSGGGDAYDDTYLDGGGRHEPFNLWKNYQLAEPTKREEIFDWARNRADKIGLADCEIQPSGSQIKLKYIQLICDAEKLTGYPGGGYADI
ncbi:MAG: hypothetical protein WBA45_13100 [Microthrixaceae bacterium]